MNSEKSIYACYEEIKRREVKELEKAIRNSGGNVTFKEDIAPIVMCNLDGFIPHPADVRITRVELRDEGDEDVLHIYGKEKGVSGCAEWYDDEMEINISDIAYSHIYFITSAIDKPLYLLHETIAQLSADIYSEVYDHFEGWTEACREIVRLAKKFEKQLNWQDDDERDYILELEKFEQEYLSTIKD